MSFLCPYRGREKDDAERTVEHTVPARMGGNIRTALRDFGNSSPRVPASDHIAAPRTSAASNPPSSIHEGRAFPFERARSKLDLGPRTVQPQQRLYLRPEPHQHDSFLPGGQGTVSPRLPRTAARRLLA